MEESPKLLEKLKRAVADSDPTAVMQAAHGLKGELRYLGAENACEVAKQLETFGRDRDPSSAAEMLRLLERELTELQFSIKHFAESSP